MLTKISHAILFITISTGLALLADSVTENDAPLCSTDSFVHETAIKDTIIQNSIEYLTWTLTGAMAISCFLGAVLKVAENDAHVNKSTFMAVTYTLIAHISLGIAIPAGYFYVKSLGNLSLNCYLLTLHYAASKNASPSGKAENDPSKITVS